MESLDLRVLADALAWHRAGHGVTLVTVVETWGSAPRPAGALLAIREFAPKSMVWLGWAFVLFGLVCLATVADVVQLEQAWMVRVNASRLMAIAFGGFHLIYGALIVTTGRREDAAA